MSQIRFHAFQGDQLVAQTPWTDELTNETAVGLLIHFREQYGSDLKYQIERTGDPKTPNPVTRFRFIMKDGDRTHYSKLINEEDREKAEAEIRGSFPEAEITVQEVS